MWYNKSDLRNSNSQIYSVNEKKTTYGKKYNHYKESFADGDSTFGEVYVVKDSNFVSSAKTNKPRQIVSLGIEQGYMKAVPVYKNKNIVELSNFDNCRSINLNLMRKIHLDNVYEKEDFNFSSNSTLTDKEKDEIRRKLAGDYTY